MLTDNYYDTVRNLFREYKHVFSTGSLDLGMTGLVQHTIELEDIHSLNNPNAEFLKACMRNYANTVAKC